MSQAHCSRATTHATSKAAIRSCAHASLGREKISFEIQWFCCNDETIVCVTTEEVLTSEAYMLFYAKNRIDFE